MPLAMGYAGVVTFVLVFCISLVAAVVSTVWCVFSCVFGVLVACAIRVAEAREMSSIQVDGFQPGGAAPDRRPPAC